MMCKKGDEQYSEPEILYYGGEASSGGVSTFPRVTSEFPRCISLWLRDRSKSSTGLWMSECSSEPSSPQAQWQAESATCHSSDAIQAQDLESQIEEKCKAMGLAKPRHKQVVLSPMHLSMNAMLTEA